MKGFADAEQCLDRDWPSRFDLLPVTRREPKTYHVFLRKSFPLANLADATAESAEESGVIDHPPVLLAHEQKDHEQISCSLRGNASGNSLKELPLDAISICVK
jgi:hypothetical protein